MGCRNGGGFKDDEDDRRSSSLVSDALLLTTMCIIGLPVDVHIKDGSIYSGIFHTACVDDRYAIVLKHARMTKKGSCESNVGNEEVIETLIVQSEDLVQVVAKRVQLPADGFAGHETGDDAGAVASTFSANGTPGTEANKTTSSEPNVDQPHTNQTRCSSGTVKGFANGFKPEPVIHSSHSLEVDTNSDAKGSAKNEEALNDADDNRKNGGCKSSGVLPSEQIVSSSSTPTETVPPKPSNSNRTAKEFKLNPGAKIFSPSCTNKRSATPPVGGNVAYIQNTTYLAVPIGTQQPEVEINPRSQPLKFVPYGNLFSGNVPNDVQHPPPLVGYMTNRSQPVRHGGQYHPVQTAPAFVQPNSQNVMVGRLGPVVYVHPAQDMVPTTNGFSQVSTCSILTPHQLHVPKHQGSAAAQALQLCATPPFIAAAAAGGGGGGCQPPFVLPSHVPISQLPYPVIRPISSNGFLVSKFS